jgi:S-adenosylmethionine hydrolase
MKVVPTRWTNIGAPIFEQLKPRCADRFQVKMLQAGATVFTDELPYVRTIGQVEDGAPLLYLNSLLRVSFALNMHDFAKKHRISSGPDWSVRGEKVSQ